MRDDDNAAMAWPAGRFSAGYLWTLMVVVLGLSLWAQIFLVPLLEELRFADHSAGVTLAYALPLAALLVGAFLRAAPLTLLAFTVCFIPGILLLPERSVIELEQTASMVRIGVTLAAFLGAAAASAAARETIGEVEFGESNPRQTVEGIFPFYFTIRAALLFGLLLLTQYAVFYDPAIAAKISEHYVERPEGARIFIGLLAFFAWCVAAYTMFFVPMMNLEYDVRRLSRSIDEYVDGGRRARWWRIGLMVIAAIAALAVLWSFA
jgi:hypothetical protein